jgi:anti-sigma28 factor (negative regulator of flagellin synthesis)
MKDDKTLHPHKGEPEQPREGRKRSPTMVKLGELAERLRKVLKIKEQVSSGSYQVSTEKIAEALIKKQANQ